MTGTTNLLGSCQHKGCDFALFATTHATANDWNDVKSDGKAYRFNNGWFGRCPNRHKVFPMRAVEGTYSEKHQCDSRCLNAKGWKCTCSCGGANHGRGYAVTVHTSTEVAEQPKGGHIGEVGKTIRGEVIVRQTATDRRPYSFTTVNGGHEVVWFAKPEFDPGFEQGERLTIRAKVKQHVDHERFGKSTTVIYVERI